MSDPHDILDKADALLGRYRGGVRPSAESDFPVLTEIVGDPEHVAEGARTENSVTEAPHKAGGADDYSRELLVKEVMRTLAPRIEEMLGEPLKEKLAEHVRNSLQSLTDQVRVDVDGLVRDAVSSAVDQVLSDGKSA